MRRFTEKGRVVYDRPKNKFKSRDVIRIGKSIGATIFEVSDKSWIYIVQDVAETLYAEDSSYSSEDDSGFGGGGVTRPFEGSNAKSIDPYRRVIIIVETVY